MSPLVTPLMISDSKPAGSPEPMNSSSVKGCSMPRTRPLPMLLAGIAGAVGAAAGAAWVWRHQGELAVRRPINEWTFTHMNRLMPTAPVAATGAEPWPERTVALDGFRYRFEGTERSLDDLHRRTFSTGFAVIHRGELVHEAYPGRFAAPDRRFQLYSLTKSVTSLLLGIARGDGLLPDLDTPVGDLLPELAGTPFADATVEQLLQMRSGVGDAEDWNVPDALINRYEKAVTGGGSLLELLRAAERTAAPDERFNYSTVDTHVLGMVLERVTGRPLAEWASERLWRPIGAETDAYYFLTRGRPRAALGGGSLNATVRDLARVGELVRNGGRWRGRQIVPESWIDRCCRAVSAGNSPGSLELEDSESYGYSTQWWLIGERPGSITGIGVHGQFLWIDPSTETVIMRTAAWPTPDDPQRSAEAHAAFLALGTWLAEHDADPVRSRR